MERKNIKDPTQNDAIGAVMKQHRNAKRAAARKNGGKNKPLCFATTNGEDCKVLKEKKCLGCDGCSFYKTVAEAKESRESAFRRIASLDSAAQSSIADMYYDGSMPWKKVLP